MTRRSDAQRQIRRLGEVREIMNSMKMLAFMETHRLAERIENQRRAIEIVERAAHEFLAFHPEVLTAVPGLAPVYLVVGSERGFCGDFNEQVLERLEARIGESEDRAPALIAVGTRICTRLADDPRVVAAIAGPDVAEAVQRTLAEIVDTVRRLRMQRGPVSLAALFQRVEPSGVSVVSLLPPFRDYTDITPRPRVAALLNSTPGDFFLGLVDHYLFASLHAALSASLMAENDRRVRHLGGALRHLDERLEALRRKANELRQEEIIEEIEVILLGASEPQRRTPEGSYAPPRLPDAGEVM